MLVTEHPLYLHLILAVSGRASFILSEGKDELENYLSEMIEINEQQMVAISCMPDHAHMLISWNPDISIDNLAFELKQLSKYFILHRGWNKTVDWQEDYAAFSCPMSDLQAETKYINRQPEYHKKKTFKEEVKALLQKHEIEYREDELLEFYD